MREQSQQSLGEKQLMVLTEEDEEDFKGRRRGRVNEAQCQDSPTHRQQHGCGTNIRSTGVGARKHARLEREDGKKSHRCLRVGWPARTLPKAAELFLHVEDHHLSSTEGRLTEHVCLTARVGQPMRQRGSEQTMGERARACGKAPAAGQSSLLAAKV